MYTPSPEMRKRLDNNFKYHPPIPGQTERYERIRAAAKDLAELILTNTPPSREQSLALTHLEDVAMWANAAIARNETSEIVLE